MKIWDNVNKQWLIVTSVIFNQAGTITRITANKEEEGNFGDPFYDLTGDDLNEIGIDFDIKHNSKLIPEE